MKGEETGAGAVSEGTQVFGGKGGKNKGVRVFPVKNNGFKYVEKEKKMVLVVGGVYGGGGGRTHILGGGRITAFLSSNILMMVMKKNNKEEGENAQIKTKIFIKNNSQGTLHSVSVNVIKLR